ncbi:MAG: ribosome biogenesis GTP-binding protein YihA/YsxC [Candidatus Sumerlaeia bacterium]
MKIQTIQKAASVSRAGDLRFDRRRQFPFAGRSNCGKSSLLNALAARRHLAPISKTPGRTRKIDYYLVNGTFYLVDLPGYGYAKLSQAARAHWAALVESYLRKSATAIPFVTVLLDSRHPPGPRDAELFAWMADWDLPIQTVFTKADKLSRHQLAALPREMERGLAALCTVKAINFIREQWAIRPPIPSSARTGMGRQELLRAIEHALKGETP